MITTSCNRRVEQFENPQTGPGTTDLVQTRVGPSLLEDFWTIWIETDHAGVAGVVESGSISLTSYGNSAEALKTFHCDAG